jgi:hypothetical protein
MTPHELLVELATIGVSVRLDGVDLQVTEPEGESVSTRHVELLRKMKPALVDLLTTHPCTGCGRFAFPRAGVVCFHCRRGA